MNKKSKKTSKKTPKVHYHICGCGDDAHKWACEGEMRHVIGKAKNGDLKFQGECNISKHALCGFSQAHDCPICIRKHVLPPKRFDYKADENGFVILYKGEPVAKERLTKKEQKVKRHHSTAKKAARDYQYGASKLVSMLDNGDGDKRIWAKIRKVDKSLKTEAVTA